MAWQGAELAANEAGEGSSKVARVSMALRDALRAVDAAAYLRPLVISHAAVGDLHGALQLIRDAKEAQLAQPADATAGAGGAQPTTTASHTKLGVVGALRRTDRLLHRRA